MSSFPSLQRIVSVLLIASLLLTSAAPIAQAQNSNTTVFLPLVSSNSATSASQPLLYRTHVRVQTTVQWRDLERMDMLILDRGADWALLLVDDAQLADLARLRYNPSDSNALSTLANVSTSAKSWNHTIRQNIGALLTQADAVSAQLASLSAANEQQGDALRNSLRQSMRSLDRDAKAAVASAATVDSDGDGLSDDAEGWWCTDPAKVDSDFDGTKDGAEVTALKAWLTQSDLENIRKKAPTSGKPFQGWPNQTATCPDDDYDSVPDLSEWNELGLRGDVESTDRDQFDDGQELFGTTKCPGSGSACGYGSLPPANTAGIVLFPEMPGWAKAPGNHPFVTALPIINVSIKEGSFTVERVTTITTQKGEMTQKQKNYSSSKTTGTSSGVTDTDTWNEWQEASITTQAVNNTQVFASVYEPNPFNICDNTFNPEILDSCIRSQQQTIMGIQKKATSSWNWISDKASSFASEAQSFVSEKKDILVDNLNWTWDTVTNYVKLNSCTIGVTTAECEFGVDPTGSGFADPNTPLLQDIARSLASAQPNLGTDRNVAAITRYYPIQYPAPPFVPTRTNTTGSSKGGSHAVTHSQYEEHTLTEGETFTTGEDWSTAVAENSAHAADFWFTYQLKNNGLDYARSICELSFNVFVGDLALPTYDVANDIAGDGCLHNFKPDNVPLERTTQKIPLSLEVMRMIDNGAPIRVVVARYVLSTEDYYASDSRSKNAAVQIEDGAEDQDGAIDTYLIPTWKTGETVLQVLQRYFPHKTDADGALIAIWTPEYGYASNPGWCIEPKRPKDYPSEAVWCKHVLSTADWWNVYTDGLGDGSQGFQDTTATPGSTALFRFNKDSDLDGFSDRSEKQLGTDINDATSFPQPELLAGIHTVTVGSKVTATLSLLNTGQYDAYGVEAVMVAPDDSITIENNTVGGSGRVAAFRQVIVGSSLKLPEPLPSAWAATDHAVPALGGYYTGNDDRSYTFTANCPLAGGCKVGEDAWTLNWNDGKGNSGTLPFGTGYKSPFFQAVGVLGMTMALYSGQVFNNDNFTVQAKTPRDTFQYTINRTPYTPPIVIVSYNDPQGNHRFVIPNQAMSLSSPTENLSQFAGEMLEDVGVEIMTSKPFTPTVDNTVSLLVNNPADKTLSNARLFLEFINISGTVVSEIPVTATLPPGPTYREISFNSANFGAGFNANEETIVMAFLTDYQGNILDTAGRPLSSFQVDPRPKLASSSNELTWSFGTLPQGTVTKFPLSLANTGFGVLYSYLPPNNGLTLDQASQSIGAADVSQYQLTLRTADLPLGAYDRTISIRTSDPQTPIVNLRVLGTVVSAPPDTPGGIIQRPLDVSVNVTGTHSQGEWVEFTHTLALDPQTLQPVRVLAQDYGTLLGVGKYATDFGQGTSSYDMFGDGRDGVMPGSGNLDNANGFALGIVNSGSAGSTSINVADNHVVSRIKPGDVVLIHQTQGSNAGCWELNKAVSQFQAGTATYQLEKPLKCGYYNGGANRAQIMRVPQYSTCNVTGTVTPLKAWDGNSGGIFAVMCNTAMTVTGSLNANSWGYRGGLGDIDSWAWTGESDQGPSIRRGIQNPPGNGGGAIHISCAGGGNGTPGISGGEDTVGDSAGSPDLSSMVMGGGGGGAGDIVNSGHGGTGGGIIVIVARSLSVSGSISSDGGSGQNTGANARSGCGGAGGSIYLQVQDANFTVGTVSASAGPHGIGSIYSASGDGGAGRVHLEYCTNIVGGTNPVAHSQKLNCYIVEQIETTPYTTARLNLPAAVNGSAIYNVQFGRKLDFAAAGNQLTQVRLPAGMVGSAKFDLLASGLPTTTTIGIDIGDDGIMDWTQAVGNNSSTPSLELADAFNDYWASHGAPSTGTIDIPVRVTTGNAGQLLITNLQIASAASSLRSIRIAARSVSQFLVDFTAGSSGQVVAALDIGDNGSIDWTTPSSEAAPKRWLTGDLKSALNQYLAGKINDVDVPIRFYISPAGAVKLNDFVIAYTAQQDLVADGINIHSGVLQAASPDIQEGDFISVTAALRNATSNNSGPVTAAFFANAPGWGDWYIGSALLPNIPANSTVQVAIPWNTTGFGGDVPVKVVVNPYQRLGETIFSNNTTTVTTFVTPNQVSQAIDFAALGDKTINDNPFTVQAFASSDLTVTFASLTSSVCTVNGTLVTLTGLAGSCTLRASQAGNLFYFAAPAVERTFQVINPNGAQPQTISFTPPSSKVYSDSSFAITATATSGLPVLVVSQSTGICTVNGFTVTIISAGACMLNASQAGNSNFLPATEVLRTVTIAKAQQTITFAALADKVFGDPDFTISASATSGAAVSFTTQTPAICTVNGALVSLVAAGSCTIRATQAGTVNYNAAPPVERSFVVNMPSDPGKTDQTISFAALGNKTYGDGLFAVRATASSGLVVSISSQTLITCTISSNVVRILTTGTCTLRAAQSGNDVYNPALPVEQSFTIFKANQTITFDGLVSRKYNDPPFALAASASSGLVVSFTALTGKVCSVSGSEVTLLAAGLCTIEASQAGNLNYNAAAPKAQSFIVEKADQQIHFEVASGYFLTQTPISLVATADSGLPVSFASLTLSVCVISGNSAELKTTGTCVISASQPGNSNFNPAATVIGSFAVSKPEIPNQLITFNPLPNRVYGDPAFTVSAVASSTLPVSFRSNTLDICTLVNKTVTIISAGTCIIQASQDGSESYNPAPPVERSFVIEKAAQEILFDPLDNQPLSVASITVAASATSGLSVTFASNTPDVCTVAGTTVTLLSGGICTLAASQPGNKNYLAADSVSQSFRVIGKSTQSIGFPPLEDKIFGDAPFVISATATSKLTVTFQSSQPTTCTVSGNGVTLLASGLCSIVATQSGDASYAAAVPVTRSFIIGKAIPIIAFAPISSRKLGDAPFTLAPTSSSGLTITLQSQTPTVCAVSGMQVALLSVGTCMLVATQSEGSNYQAVSATQIFEVLPPTESNSTRSVFLPLVNR